MSAEYGDLSSGPEPKHGLAPGGGCTNGLNAPVAGLRLLDSVAEGLGVVPNPSIARHDRNELWRFIEQLGGGQVHRVERPNGFHRKRPAHASEDDAIDANEERAAFERPQSPNGCLFLGDRQSTRDPRADDCSCGFRQRQGGRHVPPFCLERFERSRVVFQECGEESARLDVPNACDRGLDRATRGGSAPWPRPSNATLRHGRCRSSPRLCHAGVEYLASPRRGRQFQRADE